MSWWMWVGLIAPFVWSIVYFVISVRLTGRPPADLYDALRDIAGGRK